MGKNHLTPNGWQSFQPEKQFIKINKIIEPPLKADCFFPSSFFHNRIY